MTYKFQFIFAFCLIHFFSFSQTVTIGSQIWMTKNLNVASFRNGEPIQQAKTAEEWNKAQRNEQPVWCYYNNDPANGPKYGKLYNWYAINDPRGLAPIGFHIPSDEEWSILQLALGELEAVKSLKSNIGWLENGNGTNSSGFNALPGGSRSHDGNYFRGLGKQGCWYASTFVVNYDSDKVLRHYHYENNNLLPEMIVVIYSKSDKIIMGSTHASGFSVRCIKD